MSNCGRNYAFGLELATIHPSERQFAQDITDEYIDGYVPSNRPRNRRRQRSVSTTNSCNLRRQRSVSTTNSEMTQVVDALRRVADIADRDEELNRITETITPSLENLYDIALRLIDYGRSITWGAIGAIFHFAARLARRGFEFVKHWIVDFLISYLLSWISSGGGWQSIIIWVRDHLPIT